MENLHQPPKRVRRHCPGRYRPHGQDRHGIYIRRCQPREEPTNLVVRSFEPPHCFAAKKQVPFKTGERRRRREKSVRFVLNCDDANAHDAPPDRNTWKIMIDSPDFFGCALSIAKGAGLVTYM